MKSVIVLFLITVGLLLSPGVHSVHASTVIAFDSAATTTCNGGAFGTCPSTLSWSHTVGIGEYPALIVVASLHRVGGIATVTGVSYGTRPLAELCVASSFMENTLYVYYLSSAFLTSGTQSLYLAFGPDYPDEAVVGSVSYFNVDHVGLWGTSSCASGAYGHGQASITVNADAGDLVVGALAMTSNQDLAGPGADQTQRWNIRVNSVIGAVSDKFASSSPVTMTWGPGMDEWVTLGFPLKPASLYMVVRGSDNRIYYGSDVAGSWNGWNPQGSSHSPIPGSTPDSPAATRCGGKLHVAVRGSDNGIYYGYLAIPGWGDFSHFWTKLPGSTLSAPALTSASDCTLYLAVRGSDNGIYMTTYAGSSWTTWTKLPGSTVDTPALAATDTTLHIVVRGSDGLSIYHNQMDRLSLKWLGWVRISGSTPSRPALTTYGSELLFLTVRGSDNKIYLNEWKGSWGNWITLASGTTLSGPSIADHGTWLYIVVRGMDNGIYKCSRDMTYWTWSGWSKIPGFTTSAPSLAHTSG
jgi:hypothetical protein